VHFKANFRTLAVAICLVLLATTTAFAMSYWYTGWDTHWSGYSWEWETALRVDYDDFVSSNYSEVYLYELRHYIHNTGTTDDVTSWTFEATNGDGTQCGYVRAYLPEPVSPGEYHIVDVYPQVTCTLDGNHVDLQSYTYKGDWYITGGWDVWWMDDGSMWDESIN